LQGSAATDRGNPIIMSCINHQSIISFTSGIKAHIKYREKDRQSTQTDMTRLYIYIKMLGTKA